MKLDFIEYLKIPHNIAFVLVCVFLVIQGLGEFLEFKGKIVPEIMKVRKRFARKKKEREILAKLPSTLLEVTTLLNDVNQHYSKDNITMRDNWMKGVNAKIYETQEWMKEFNQKLDKNNADTLSLLIDSKRNTIINFASHVIDENYSVTREQFKRIFKLYEEYEDIIESNGMTNGEVDIAYRIITESYENHMKKHSFIEDVRGYDI